MKSTPLPETSPSPWPVTRSGLKSLLWAAFFGLAVRGVFPALENHHTTAALRLALVAASFVPAALCLHHMIRWVRGLDELQQRIQLQSFAAVFPGLLLTITGNELLRVAGFPTGVDLGFRSVGFAMLIIYAVTFLWLWRKTR